MNKGAKIMERGIDVAQFIFIEYKKLSSECIDEMKLHKLLYLVQREAIALTGEPMISCEFEGWTYGPVCRSVRNNYTVDGMYEKCNEIAFDSAYIVRNILEEYGSVESWKLSKLTHKETSWLVARNGLADDEKGDVPLKISDIYKDAKKVRPYDYIWDMYYDEFDDVKSATI
jgi:uncharacterized phage-associated protein